MNFNPPFEQFKFGLQKEYILASGSIDLEQHNNNLSETMAKIVQTTFGEKKTVLIGKYDNYIGFFILKDDPSGAVYTLCVEKSSTTLTQVADSITALYRICEDIKSFWEEHKGKRFLPKNPETVARMKKIMADFQQYSPNSYSRFWLEHAMGELMIGLEL
jgi:hypothetical protein